MMTKLLTQDHLSLLPYLPNDEELHDWFNSLPDVNSEPVGWLIRGGGDPKSDISKRRWEFRDFNPEPTCAWEQQQIVEVFKTPQPSRVTELTLSELKRLYVQKGGDLNELQAGYTEIYDVIKRHGVEHKDAIDNARQRLYAKKVAELEVDKAKLIDILKRLDEWLKVRHLGGLMPDEKKLIEEMEAKK